MQGPDFDVLVYDQVDALGNQVARQVKFSEYAAGRERIWITGQDGVLSHHSVDEAEKIMRERSQPQTRSNPMSSEPRAYTQPAHDEDLKARLRSDVEAELSGDTAEPGQLKAANFDKIKKGLATLDAALDKFVPVAAGLAPAQYRALILAIAALVNGANEIVN